MYFKWIGEQCKAIFSRCNNLNNRSLGASETPKEYVGFREHTLCILNGSVSSIEQLLSLCCQFNSLNNTNVGHIQSTQKII